MDPMGERGRQGAAPLGHTPGPWTTHRAAERPSSGETWEVRGGLGQSFVIAGVEPWEESAANARLIAAAPELLEALENLLAASVSKVDHWKHPSLTDARAAIAKARGEQ